MCAGSGKALARFAHEGDGLGEDDPDRVANLHRLFVAGPREVEAVDRGDRQLDGEPDRVVGPSHPLGALHLLGHLAEAAPQLVRISEQAAEWVRAFHLTDVTPRLPPPCEGRG
jgi:hypothetical protein